MPHTIRTDRLLLRPPAPRDGAPFARVVNDWEVTVSTGTWPYPVTPEYARFRFAQAARADPRTDRLFLICAGGAVVGSIGLHRRRGDVFGLGYWIGKAWWGRGLTTEAARAVCRHGFGVMRAGRIAADVFQDNPASVRVLEKLGFVRAADPGPGWSATRGASFPRHAYVADRTALR